MLILPPHNLTSWVLSVLKRDLFPSPISLPLFCFLKLKMLKALSFLLYLMSQCNKVLFTYHQKKRASLKSRKTERESEQFIGLKVLQGMLMLCSSEFLIYIYIILSSYFWCWKLRKVSLLVYHLLVHHCRKLPILWLFIHAGFAHWARI